MDRPADPASSSLKNANAIVLGKSRIGCAKAAELRLFYCYFRSQDDGSRLELHPGREKLHIKENLLVFLLGVGCTFALIFGCTYDFCMMDKKHKNF